MSFRHVVKGHDITSHESDAFKNNSLEAIDARVKGRTVYFNIQSNINTERLLWGIW